MAALIVRLRSSTAPRHRHAALLDRLTNAEDRIARAAASCRSSDEAAARHRLARAISAMARFRHRLRRYNGAYAIPPALRAELMAAGKQTGASVRALRRTLHCPEAVVATDSR